MLSLPPSVRIFVCRVPADMRRSFDGLSALVRNHLGHDPLDGSWYCFINRRQTQIKVLTFEDGGYCLWSKRLEEGQFARLGPADLIKRTLSHTEFLALLEGVDMAIKRQRKRWRKVA